ncbi:3-dehydroquinate synthase [Candidatus Nitrosotenuis uzonensis]|uniref:3-dehydroquinate synthase n=1 Tax=Candidatus Nitrosotenuis uzonensis TaxID=1407055 RepID=V6AQN6_9ARCH|nr:3-dehydroquinate synthase [Candidatus Nitrosotenuis uzonensis]
MERNQQRKQKKDLEKNKHLVILPKVSKAALAKFLISLEREGIKTVYADPKTLGRSKMASMYPSPAAKMVVLEKDVSRPKGKKVGKRFKVLSNTDIEGIFTEAKKGLDFVIIEVKDWKIIPLENIIAKLHKMHTEIFAMARTPEEVRKMFSILEVGVDGVIYEASSVAGVKEAMTYLGSSSFELGQAKIIDIKAVGDGERVCVDTASMLHRGEGMLIGSRSNFLFLVHNESVGSSFTSPRPFRVNAGAVHCYTLSPDGTTKYLSELETGAEVIIVDSKGNARRATVGRSKIERRPMLMIKAQIGDEIGGIIAQDAETIRFVRPGGHLVSVTHLKKGDTVLVYAKSATGRHFGMEVSDEYILEK